MVKTGILSLLRASKRSSALDTPVNVGVSNADAWPTKEHESLKGALKKEKFVTDLMLVMQFNQINLHRDSQGIASEDLPNFILQHENALSYKIDGTVTNKGSLYNFEQRLKK